MNVNKPTTRLLVALPCCFLWGCGIYSFQGSSTAAHNIQVAEFYNNTELAPANLAQTFTNRLKDYYQRNSGLRIANSDGELYIEGEIMGYEVTSRAPTAADQSGINSAALSRLSITVKVSYTDSIEPKNSFTDRQFSFYEDFPNTENLVDVQTDLERRIFDQILLDIFNATVANW